MIKNPDADMVVQYIRPIESLLSLEGPAFFLHSVDGFSSRTIDPINSQG